MQPARIVSLLPGATEIVSALGLEDRLVGISAECDQPPSVLNRRRVSLAALDPKETDPAAIDREVRDRLASGAPLFQADQAALRELEPELILSQSLCDVCAATPGSLTAEAIGDGIDAGFGIEQVIVLVGGADGSPLRERERFLKHGREGSAPERQGKRKAASGMGAADLVAVVWQYLKEEIAVGFGEEA